MHLAFDKRNNDWLQCTCIGHGGYIFFIERRVTCSAHVFVIEMEIWNKLMCWN
jgi:hypothetical protein